MNDLSSALDLLSRTPRVLFALLEGMPDHWITQTEGPNTWCARDIVGHLIHADEVDWVVRARIIREHGVSRPFDPLDREAQFQRFTTASMTELLTRFASVRAENLRTVRGWDLRDEDLDLRGQHPALGSVTLGQLLSTWCVHDLGHLNQVSRVLARVEGPGVGPWKAYLSVLQPRGVAAT